jgi:FMN-dependent oxidoreductase (nitrilotriacetate monooxygenase family)
MSARQLHLSAFLRPASIHAGAWRYPGSFADANFNFAHYRRFAACLERACFDAIFLADSLALAQQPVATLSRSASTTSFEPLTLLSALAPLTDHIGLIATVSTTYNEPFHVARRLASLDHLSGGRAGWNLVTSGNPNEAKNFGLEEHVEHAERYDRAREFHAVVTGLWDSWADDAFVRDVEAGLYFDPHKLHVLEHTGPHFKVRGPLNIARPLQGWPVVVQAGSSEAGREIAAETAEVVFSAPSTLADSRALYADIKGRMGQHGRDPESLQILPAAFVVVGDTLADAREKMRRLDSLVPAESGLGALSVALGNVDLTGVDLDGPLPHIPETNASKGSRQRLLDHARRENATVRQLCQHIGGSYGSLELIGTPTSIVDQMEEWLMTGGSDGFNVLFPYLPGGLDDFVDKVVPELQRRNLFRLQYPGAARGRTTLRESLGLGRPVNRFFEPTSR